MRTRTIGAVASLAALFTAALAPARVVPPHLSWTEDPQTTVTVSWERDEPGRGTVWCGATTNYGTSVSDRGGYRRHTILLEDLSPGQMYHYKASSTDGFETPDRTFWTAPSPTGFLHFVVHGDLQGGLDEGWARTVVERIVEEEPQLVIHMGDLSDEKYTEDAWATWPQFFNVATDELDRVVFMPTAGNHDDPADGNTFFFRIFALPPRPARERYYSYNAGNIHFVVLNSDVDVLAQTNWLARDLQAAANDTNVTWIVPYFHRPPYVYGGHEPDGVVKTNWCPLFVRYEADIVFNGHSHTYQRTKEVRGIPYVVTGGGGATPYSTYDDENLVFHTTCFHHVSAQVTGAFMRLRGIRSDGMVFDDVVFTNQGRFVRVDPAFPLRGRPVRITYKAAGGPLAGADPVCIHLGLDGFGAAIISTAMTYNAAAGLWQYDYTVPGTTQQRLAWVFRNEAATTWDNNYDHNWQALLGRVEILPSMPTAGASATIRYEEEIGPLAASSPICARIGFDNWKHPLGYDPVLTNNPAEGVLECQVPMPGYARELNVVFHDGSEWDENEGIEWRAVVAGATSAPPWLALPLAVPGSPYVSTNPAPQNNTGDNFDFDLYGTPIDSHLVRQGFGDFGEIYVNYDETNLYVGGLAADLGGTDNVMVVFLGLDTLSDNAETLLHKSNKPNTLDYMHNLTFTEPMDIAIVLGSEWGDGPAYTNFDYGGYNFGQGIYYIGTNSAGFAPLAGAGLSQFDGTNATPCASGDDDGDEQTDRWEARLPWSALNAPAGMDSLNCVLLAGVIGSKSTNGNDRYLSSMWLGHEMSGMADQYGNNGYGVMVIEPAKIALPRGDEDADGLPNGWEHEHFGSVAGPGAEEDSDFDLQINEDEYVAGTQPTNSGSVFEAASERAEGGGFVVSWPSAANRTYDVLQSTNLAAGFVVLQAGIPATVPENAYTDTVSGLEHSFYRVDVRK